ncbi:MULTISPECIES: helix-turn-helix transcriptional regulator [Serratia]|uniref:helix-turn-helix transcriptional regulator n=1 Tax=Serratia TaxID=613 RepID=UPI001F4BF5E0|nr:MULTISPECIES: LuxR family transcriptional regulator [Serratia]ULG10913.1 helix-turn-helix transcriptional regulator [Serratia entomophila]CAI1946165.1 Transcriptional regulatory protein uhpA [Serratia quinivorans]CAI2160028.1 Transcriptional regulatory protein uhpA [Serratia quinivorans]
MKKVVTVCILDENRFFIQGIQFILLSYFQRRGQRVHFVDEMEVTQANLVFWSVRKGWPLQLCLHTSPLQSAAPVYISIRASHAENHSGCRHEKGNLWRRACPQAVLTLVEEGLRTTEGDEASTALCSYCTSLALTEREREVMRCLSQTRPLKRLHLHLNISPKTISSHKRTVMRKLGFRRNIELYHWLLLGGLDQVKRD